MATLSYAQRKKLAPDDFGLIEKRKSKRDPGKTITKKRFPLNDKAHERNALARLDQAKGLSPSERKKIKDKAEKKLYGTSNNKSIAQMKKRHAKKRKKTHKP